MPRLAGQAVLPVPGPGDRAVRCIVWLIFFPVTHDTDIGSTCASRKVAGCMRTTLGFSWRRSRVRLTTVSPRTQLSVSVRSIGFWFCCFFALFFFFWKLTSSAALPVPFDWPGLCFEYATLSALLFVDMVGMEIVGLWVGGAEVLAGRLGAASLPGFMVSAQRYFALHQCCWYLVIMSLGTNLTENGVCWFSCWRGFSVWGVWRLLARRKVWCNRSSGSEKPLSRWLGILQDLAAIQIPWTFLPSFSDNHRLVCSDLP